MIRHAPNRTIRHGAVMSEFVLVMPLLILILALVWFFGVAVTRAQRNIVMTRYETWRSADAAPGPSSPGASDNALLNQAFFNDRADTIETVRADGWFADAPYDWWVAEAAAASEDALMMVESFVQAPRAIGYRLPHGERRTFSTNFAGESAMWRRLETPIVATHHRLASDWRYTIDWRAGADVWARDLPRGFGDNVMAASRDAFLTELDDALAANDDASFSVSLIDMLRSLYSTVPGYRGPTVDAIP